MNVSFDVKKVDITYLAEFSRPVIDLMSEARSPDFIKDIASRFGLMLKDIIFNAQAMSQSFVSFRKFFSPDGFFDASVGVDCLSFSIYNVQNKSQSWDYCVTLLDAYDKFSSMSLDKQVLTFNLHAKSAEISGKDFINRHNIFDPANKYLLSKSASCTFTGPLENSKTLFLFDESLLIPDGVYFMVQNTYQNGPKDYKIIFDSSFDFVMSEILPCFGIDFANLR